MKLLCAFVALSFSFATCKVVKFKDCGSVNGVVTNVFIDPCKETPCILHKGGNSTISVSFKPKAQVTAVKAMVHGIIAGIPVPFPITGDDGCKVSGLTCPLKPGVEVKYFKLIEVSPSYPSLKLLVKWELQDQSKKDLVCVEMAVQLK
eukprot:Seg335.3 transcript_id=Seg335.3/GoldUCD/mRNA.D3Y31 product="Prolyl-tRNA synthetase associated domain-containing protein 1" protein_id=Seg335.3/GoldUCD/D3Y31